MPAELEPFAALWVAALQLLVADAHRAAHMGAMAGEDAVEAFHDVMSCGPILRRLCAPVAIDPELISRAMRVELGLRKAA